MDELRKIVAESQVEQRTTFMVEELMRVRREGFEKSGSHGLFHLLCLAVERIPCQCFPVQVALRPSGRALNQQAVHDAPPRQDCCHLPIRRGACAGFPAVEADLDLVETEDRVTHKLDLDDENLKAQTELDIFREDADYEKHEEDWQVSPNNTAFDSAAPQLAGFVGPAFVGMHSWTVKTEESVCLHVDSHGSNSAAWFRQLCSTWLQATALLAG